MAEADFDSVRPALDSAGEESEDGESDQSDFVDVLEPGDVVVLDPVPSAAASGGGASTISSSSSSSSNTNSGGGGDGSSMVPHMASDVPDWMQSLGALPQSARVDRTAINQNFKDYSTREADAVVTREDGVSVAFVRNLSGMDSWQHSLRFSAQPDNLPGIPFMSVESLLIAGPGCRALAKPPTLTGQAGHFGPGERNKERDSQAHSR